MTAEHIENAIAKAQKGDSDIDEGILSIRGFSTKTIRILFHELCKSETPITYLEVGLFCGASFCASFNKHCMSVGVEDHSQDFSAGFELVKQELKDNFNKFEDRARDARIHYADCFTMDKSVLPNDIDIYSYDGWHSLEHQAKALPYFLDKMAKTFIWVIDDINWDYVDAGTEMGLNEVKDKIEILNAWTMRGHYLQNDAVWHNGVRIYLINKK